MIFLTAAVFLACLAYLYVSERHNRAERRELYQRIQAPQLAVNEMAAATDLLGSYVSPDDDEGFEAYKTELLS